MSEQNYRCGDCGKEWTADEKTCSACGSSRRCSPVFAYGTVVIRSNLGLKVKDKRTGKTEKKSIIRSKVSKYGKEAKEELTIDIVGNRKFHHVEEQDKNGQWITVHHEDEPLRRKNKGKGLSQPRIGLKY